MPTIQFINFSEDAPKASKPVPLNEINSKKDLVKLAKQTMKANKGQKQDLEITMETIK